MLYDFKIMFEYRKDIKHDSRKDRFNEDIYLRDMGRDKWELVSIVKEDGLRDYYFKRTLQ